MLVYLLYNRVNDKIYVGQTTTTLNKRWHEHVAHAAAGIRNSIISAAIKKHGRGNFDRFVLVGDLKSQSQLDNAERAWITILRSSERHIGYNVSLGGRFSSHGEETRNKISHTMRAKGIQPSIEIRISGNDSNRGRKRSMEARRKMAAAKNGIPSPLRGRTFPQFHGRHVHTEETKEKSRIRMTGNKFWFGRTHTLEARKQISEKQFGPLNHRFGKPALNKGVRRTDDERRKMREGWARRKAAKAGLQAAPQAQLPAPASAAA